MSFSLIYKYRDMAGIGIGVGVGLYRRSRVRYSARSKAYFDAMDVQLPSATKKVIDAAIVATEDVNTP